MAYTVLLSLSQLLERTLHHDYSCLIFDERQQIMSLLQRVCSLQDFLENSSQKSNEVIECLESRIINAVYEVEDVVEFHMRDRVLSRSESLGDGDESFETFGVYLEEAVKEFDSIEKETREMGIKDQQPLTSLLCADSPKQPVFSGTSFVVGLDDDFGEDQGSTNKRFFQS